MPIRVSPRIALERALFAAVLVTSAALLQPRSGWTAESEGATHASIPFADLGAVRSWRPDGTEALLVQAQDGTWYRGLFLAPCHSLPFSSAIGFVTDGLNRIDRFSSILTDGERCWFRSFERIQSPERSAPDAKEAES